MSGTDSSKSSKKIYRDRPTTDRELNELSRHIRGFTIEKKWVLKGFFSGTSLGYGIDLKAPKTAQNIFELIQQSTLAADPLLLIEHVIKLLQTACNTPKEKRDQTTLNFYNYWLNRLVEHQEYLISTNAPVSLLAVGGAGESTYQPRNQAKVLPTLLLPLAANPSVHPLSTPCLWKGRDILMECKIRNSEPFPEVSMIFSPSSRCSSESIASEPSPAAAMNTPYE